MKSLLLLFLLAFTSSSAMAGWTKVAANEGGDIYYVDVSTKLRTGSSVRIFTLWDLKNARVFNGGKNYYSIETQKEYDCTERKQRELFMTFHGFNMGDGETVYMVNKPSAWLVIPHGSPAEWTFNIACGKQ